MLNFGSLSQAKKMKVKKLCILTPWLKRQVMFSMLLQKIIIWPSVQTIPHNLKKQKDAAYPQSPLHNTAWVIFRKQTKPQPSPIPREAPDARGCPGVSQSCPMPRHPTELLLLLASSFLSFLQTPWSPKGKLENFMRQKFSCLMCSFRTQMVLKMLGFFCCWSKGHFLFYLIPYIG